MTIVTVLNHHNNLLNSFMQKKRLSENVINSVVYFSPFFAILHICTNTGSPDRLTHPHICSTINPFYTNTRYYDKMHYNEILTATKSPQKKESWGTNIGKTSDTSQTTDAQRKKNCNRGTALRQTVGNIMKTRLFKYIEHFTTKKEKFSDKKHLIFFIFLLKS